MKLRLVLAGLLVPWLLLAYCTESLAQAHIAGQKVDPGRVDVSVPGIIGSDSLVYPLGTTSPSLPLPTTEQNPLYSHWVRTSTNVLAWTPSGAGNYIQSGSPISTYEYKEGMLLVSFATTDTDSIALDIYLVARISNAADGLYYLIDTDPSTSQIDGFFVTKAYTTLGTAVSSGYRIQTKSVGASGGFVYSSVFTTAQVAIPLSYKNGAPIPLPPFLQLWVVNRRATNATPTHGAVTIDFWGRY